MASEREISFNRIRPYCNDEVKAALKRIVEDDIFYGACNYLFPGEPVDMIKDALTKIDTVKDFQHVFMHSAISTIARKTSTSFTIDGLSQIKSGVPCLFVSNHRDILLDTCLLQMALVDSGLDTSEIAFGNNLIMSSAINDFLKLNKLVTVIRDGSKREMLENSIILSQYIRETITKNNNSFWIAQRGGRTKDGLDKTEVGLLKMFQLSSKNNFIEDFEELNIVPVSISYEYEPCDFDKANEVYASMDDMYEKSENEDFQSTIKGIVQDKGRIHIQIGKPVNCELSSIDKQYKNNQEKLRALVDIIDECIYSGYKLWPTNYIASDLLTQTNKYSEHYTKNEKEVFIHRMKNGLDGMCADYESVSMVFLEMYANPLTSKIL